MAIKILDCTLRDGGYVNDWNFGNSNIKSIMSKLVSSNIDSIEIGFLDERVNKDLNKSIMPDMNTMNEIYGEIDKQNTEFVAMIDIGTFGIEKVLPKSETCIDGIRVIFQQNKIDEAMLFCKQLKEKGYKVFANAVMITKYKSDEEIVELINKVNNTKVDAVTFVDTYGIMYPNDVKHCYELFEKYTDSNISIGFHSHNTLQMSFANCIDLSTYAKKERDIYMDTTLIGMGKGAGNTHTELLISYANKTNMTGRKYNINYIMSAIEDEIKEIQNRIPWGYSLSRFVSTVNDTYYKYTDYYLSIGLTYKQIEEIEGSIKKEDKFKFTSQLADKYYDEYKNKKNFDCVIFDFDGTLANTKNGIFEAIDYSTSVCGLRYLTEEEKAKFLGPSIYDSFKKTYNLTDEQTLVVVRIFRDKYQKATMYNSYVYNGIKELLEQLKSKDIKLGVASNKREDLLRALLDNFNLSKYFNVVHGTDFGGKLTKVNVLRKTISELNPTSLDRVVMIGDSKSDYISSSSIGIKFIGVTYGFGYQEKDIIKEKQYELVRSTRDVANRII